MIWSSLPSWAPSIELTLQSQTPFFIEFALFGIVTVIIFLALLVSAPSSSPPIGGRSPQEPSWTSMSTLEPVEKDDVADDSGAGDGQALCRESHGLGWVYSTRELLATNIVFVSCDACAACRLFEGATSRRMASSESLESLTPYEPRDPPGTTSCSEGQESSRVMDSLPMFLVEESAGIQDADLSQQPDEVADVPQEVPDVPEEGRSMVGYVTARYRAFRSAALAGQLLVADPATSLLSEEDLVVILSNALRRRDHDV